MPKETLKVFAISTMKRVNMVVEAATAAVATIIAGIKSLLGRSLSIIDPTSLSVNLELTTCRILL